MSVAAVLALASEQGRVCPAPHAWQRLYALLPHTRRDAYGAIPAEPPTGAAWADTTDTHKVDRLREHLDWAAQHGALNAVREFLAALPESQWHHAGD